MTPQPAPDPTNPLPWLTETLRLSAFPSIPGNVEPAQWWEEAVGQPAENHKFQRTTGVTQDDGPFHGGKLILAVQPLRIDWLFQTSATPTPEEIEPSLDQLLALDAAMELFQRVADYWLGVSPPLARLAFGAILAIPVDDRPTGYRRLSEYLPNVSIDPDHSSDFLYQINRPRDSRIIPTLRINRLSKWAVAKSIAAQIVLGPGPLQVASTGLERLSVRLELDINTAAEYNGNLSGAQLPNLYRELTDLGREIAARGDIE